MAKNPHIRQIEATLQKIARVEVRQIVRETAKIAQDHFRENFRQGGFVNGGLKRWPEVKRRIPSSPWYGFEYKGEKRTSYRFKRDRKTGKTVKSASQKKLNYSQAATQRTPLTSKRNYLMNATKGVVQGGGAVIKNAAPYAKIHNEGGTFRVFGKHAARMPKRQFVGQSKELNTKIQKMVEGRINNIFKTVK